MGVGRGEVYPAGRGVSKAMLVPPTRSRLLLTGTLMALAGPVALAVAASSAARPATSVPWRGPRPGGTWTRTSLTLQANALIAEPSRLGVVFAGTVDGVWRSDDGGLRWARAGSGLHGNTIVALALAPADDTLFAGSDDGAVYEMATRQAGHWRRVSASLNGTPVLSLAVGPGRRPALLAGTIGALYRGWAGGSGWRWQRVAQTGQAAISSIVWLPAHAGSALAAVFGVSPAVLATRDGGRTWVADAGGLPAVLPTQTLLPVGPQQPSTILTTMGGGVWERPAGGSWHEISAGLPARHAMALVALPGSGTRVLYAGTMGDGVYVKQAAAPWRSLGHGLLGTENTILSLAVVSGSPPGLLAGTALGVYRYAPPR